jgi:hypothetical protein
MIKIKASKVYNQIQIFVDNYALNVKSIGVNHRHLYIDGKYVYIHTLTSKGVELFTPWVITEYSENYPGMPLEKALEYFVRDYERHLSKESTCARVKQFKLLDDGTYVPIVKERKNYE